MPSGPALLRAAWAQRVKGLVTLGVVVVVLLGLGMVWPTGGRVLWWVVAGVMALWGLVTLASAVGLTHVSLTQESEREHLRWNLLTVGLSVLELVIEVVVLVWLGKHLGAWPFE
jgi:hypothetical protein